MNLLSSLFRSSPSSPRPSLDARLTDGRVMLRAADVADWKQWRALRDMSRDFLTPWEPQWPPQALSYGFYCSLLRRQWREWRSGIGYSFLIFKCGEAGRLPLVGGIALNEIQRGAAQKGTVGYWMGVPYAGQGYMTAALALVCDFAFGALRLNRIEAGCLPHNERSKALLRRAGFEEEGIAKAYMQINGTREDHILWGRNARPGG